MTGNRRRTPRAMVVVGGGPVALAAAIGFAGAAPGARVTLVPASVPGDAFADRLPVAAPSCFETLDRLGCPSDLLLRSGVARPRAASRFRDWSADGALWMLCDDPTPAVAGVALHQLWLRAGAPLAYHALFPACAGAIAAEPALHLDPRLLCEGLAALAAHRGVALADAALAAVEPGSESLAAVRLNNGTRLTADLFVDASGPARSLIAGLADPPGYEDWRDALGTDALLLAPAAPADDAIDTYRRIGAGWSARWPGATGLAWSPRCGTNEAAARAAMGVAGARAEAVAFAPGRLRAPWSGNVLALGEAAAQPGPLMLTGFTLAMAQIGLALDLLPTGADEPMLRAEYNRRAALRADRLRDFIGALMAADPSPQGRFWTMMRASPRPVSLTALLGQFARRGLVTSSDEETVPRDAWAAALIGQGMRPARPDPIALGIPRTHAAALIADVAARARGAR